jgi:aspartate/methionine/tyrosine aminotransferase
MRLRYRRMPIEEESPEQLGYGRIRHNLAESSVADAALADLGTDLGALVLQYGDHLGLPALRQLVASDGAGLAPDDVLVTPGAVAALFIIHTTLLEAGSHAIVARPNYATNVETPRTVGADVEYLDLSFEDGWAVDPDRIAAMLRPETRLVSLTTPHNPTGATLSRETLDAVIGLVERHGEARLLVDETYREMTFGEALPVAASLSDRVISVSSLSKTYGLPGIRVGWLVTRDGELFGRLLAAKEQILISGSLVDETIAVRALQLRPSWLPEIRSRIAEALSVTASWIEGNPRFEWVPPRGGVVGFPRIRPGVAAGLDVDRFYETLFERHGTVVGPGHWFEQPRTSFRLGYGWPALDELRGGLAALDAALDEVRGASRLASPSQV